MKKYFIGLFLSLSTFVFAQNITYPAAFQDLLTEVSIEIFTPFDSKYRDFEPHNNQLEKYDFRIVSRKEKLDIRYAVKPCRKGDIMSHNPHLLTMRAVASVATNEQDYVISALEMSKEKLQNDFNADWGMTYFFTPKNDFARTPHCRMIALHKEGKGTAFVFYLFDNVKNEALNRRYFSMQFLKEKISID
ncbi:MAG: hypothetical protein ACI9XO_000643 [Paraglaciecola sp.]|jgi:hypothetical protein